ncbi:hypothetical protein AcV7_000157 [Taiwanofungus camphoratus]|nr:hypothetical protein AcV7_000157 [Antrodia cinnamomea]
MAASELVDNANTVCPSAAQRLRIAIAIIALHFKPADQSYEAYILDLQAKYSLPETAPLACGHDPSWRDRVILLEKNLSELQKKYDSEHVELVCLRDAQSTSQTSGDSSTVPASKKKQKKKGPQQARAAVHMLGKTNLEGILAGARLSFLQAPSHQNILSDIDKLETLVSIRASRVSSVSDDLLIATTKRALDALVTQGYPVIDDIIGHMVTSILIPLIRSFTPLSRIYLSALFSPTRHKKKQARSDGRKDAKVVDIRTEIITLLDQTMSALENLTGTLAITSNRNVRHLLSLESVREVQRLYSEKGSQDHNVDQEIRSGRVHMSRKSNRLDALIRKDAVWYLCNVLHLVGPAKPGTPPSEPSNEQDTLFEEAIHPLLSALIRRSRGSTSFGLLSAQAAKASEMGSEAATRSPRYEMDEVERGMILAVIERGWFGM